MSQDRYAQLFAPHFDGKTYEPALDHARLTSQLDRVRELMRDGQWRTLHDILVAVDGASEAAISARLRDLRKAKFGLFHVERRRVAGGLFEYRVGKA